MPIQINRSSVAVQPTSTIDLNANLPATETQFGASGNMLPVTVEYFDNLGASQTLSFNFTPTLPAAAGDPQTNTWTLDIIDQASGLSAGTYEIVFGATPPNAGYPTSVTQTVAGTAPLSTVYDAATGDITLGLGSQNITLGVGSTAGGPQHLSQLSSTFSPTGVTKDGNAAGTFTGVSIDENGFLYASYSSGFSKVIYQVPVVDVPNPNGLRVLDNQCFALSKDAGSMFLWDAGSGPDRRRRGLRPRAVDHRHRERAHPADPDPARLLVERQDHPDRRRDAAGNHQPEALTARGLRKGLPHEHLRRAEQRRLGPRRFGAARRHHRQQRGERDDAGLRPAHHRALVARARRLRLGGAHRRRPAGPRTRS